MRRLFKTALVLSILIGIAMVIPPAIASQEMPGKGVKVQAARATWNTDFFLYMGSQLDHLQA
jgi:hypothetical protein